MPRVTRTVVLPATPAQVWEVVGSPDRLARWLGVDLQLDMRPGGLGVAHEQDGSVRWLVVDDVRPEARLAFSWWPLEDEDLASVVEIDLEPVDGGTRLRVTETAMPAATGSSSASSPGAPRALASTLA